MPNIPATASIDWLPETGRVIITYRGKQRSLHGKAGSYEEALMLANTYMKEQDDAVRRAEIEPGQQAGRNLRLTWIVTSPDRHRLRGISDAANWQIGF